MITPQQATRVRVFYGAHGWELDAADDKDAYTDENWTHANDTVLSRDRALTLVDKFRSYIGRPELPVYVYDSPKHGVLLCPAEPAAFTHQA